MPTTPEILAMLLSDLDPSTIISTPLPCSCVVYSTGWTILGRDRCAAHYDLTMERGT